jgi:hypothetical protein
MKQIVGTFALAVSMLLAAAPLHAASTTYRATLSGPAESPPNASPGTGMATLVIDDSAMTANLHVSFMDLVGTTSASHIHCCTTDPLTGAAGVATMTPSFVDFPLGVSSGVYDHSFSLADPAFYNPAFLSAHGGTADAAAAYLLNGIAANEAYLNIHTSQYPSGEVRGFLVAVPVPEPGSWAMLGIGLAGIAFCYRRQA